MVAVWSGTSLIYFRLIFSILWGGVPRPTRYGVFPADSYRVNLKKRNPPENGHNPESIHFMEKLKSISESRSYVLPSDTYIAGLRLRVTEYRCVENHRQISEMSKSVYVLFSCKQIRSPGKEQEHNFLCYNLFFWNNNNDNTYIWLS